MRLLAGLFLLLLLTCVANAQGFLGVVGTGVVVNGISALRGSTPVTGASTIFLNYYSTPGDLGYGLFIPKSGASPGTYVDDGGTIIVPTGGNGSAAWLRVWDGTHVDMGWFGAKFDHVADDYSAWLSAVSLFSNLGGRTAIKDGVIDVHGGFAHSKSLLYVGTASYNLVIQGDIGGARGGTVASYLNYTGSTTPCAVYFYGANESTIQDINIDNSNAVTNFCAISDDGTNTTFTANVSTGTQTVTPASMTSITTGRYLGVGTGADFEIIQVTGTTGSTFTATFANAHTSGEQIGNGPGSSGVKLRNMFIQVGTTTSSVGIFVGNNTSGSTDQVSEIVFTNVNVQGDNVHSYAAYEQTESGNTKNMYFNNFTYAGTQYAFYMPGCSGVNTWVRPVGGNVLNTVFVLGACEAVINAIEDESTARMLTGNPGSNSGSATFFGGSWQGGPPVSDNIIVNYQGALTLIGTNVYNNVTANQPGIFVTGPNGSGIPTSFTAIGGYFEYAANGTKFIEDGSGNDAINSPSYDTGQQISRLTMLNNYGGVAGSLTNLNNVLPRVPLWNVYSAATQALPTCDSVNLGDEKMVTDATTPTYLGTYASGGAVTAKVFCNGSNWITH